ncbi:MAG: hypothetical protein R2851_27360 [Caldilineaceae bacterium]
MALTIFTSRLAPLPEFTDVVYSASGLWHDAYARWWTWCRPRWPRACRASSLGSFVS